MKRKRTATHDFWHSRVEGQVRHTMNEHPEWFTDLARKYQAAVVNSVAKRVVGEIVAVSRMAANRSEVAVNCLDSGEADGGCPLPSAGGEVAVTASSPHSDARIAAFLAIDPQPLVLYGNPARVAYTLHDAQRLVREMDAETKQLRAQLAALIPVADFGSWQMSPPNAAANVIEEAAKLIGPGIPVERYRPW